MLFVCGSGIEGGFGGAPNNGMPYMPYPVCAASALYSQLQGIQTATQNANKDMTNTVKTAFAFAAPTRGFAFLMNLKAITTPMVAEGVLAGVAAKTYFGILPKWSRDVANAGAQFEKDMKACGGAE